MLPEGGQGGDAGHVLLVRAGGHVAQWLQFALGAIVTHVAVEDGGCGEAKVYMSTNSLSLQVQGGLSPIIALSLRKVGSQLQSFILTFPKKY